MVKNGKVTPKGGQEDEGKRYRDTPPAYPAEPNKRIDQKGDPA